MEAVVMQDPERMNLLGLILKSILEINLTEEKKARKAAKIRGKIGVQAGEMKVTLHCDSGKFKIVRGHEEKSNARVRGGLKPFLEIALGGGLVQPVIDGEVKIGGNPFLLLKLIPLLRVPERGKE